MTDPFADTRPTRPPRARKSHPNRSRLAAALLSIFFLILMLLSGGFIGYRNGLALRQSSSQSQAQQMLSEQLLLGRQDRVEGRLEVARQRFEWILGQDAAFPGAADELAQVLAILHATATPTALPPSPTPSPTPDLRPVQELFTQANAEFSAGNWAAVIDTLTNLRKSDATYEVAAVDRLFYLALLNLGLAKIQAEGNLEGGIYDLALAERFGPLDRTAATWRDLARMYLFGSSFWEVYPEQAVYYFSQVVQGQPYLADASGWTAIDRLRQSYIQWGDQLARQEDWCGAQAQYEQAAAIRGGNGLENTIDAARLKCSPPTPSGTPTLTETPTPTETVTPTATATGTLEFPSLTPTPPESPTPTPSETPTPTPPIVAPSETPTPTPESPTPEAPSPTPTPTPGIESGGALSSLPLAGVLAFSLLLGTVQSNADTQPSPAQRPGQPKKPAHSKRAAKNMRAWKIFFMLLVLLLGVGAFVAAFFTGRELAFFGSGGSQFSGPSVSGEITGTPGAPLPPGSTGAAADALPLPTLTPWDGASRVTVLLLGLDQRDWKASEKASRSDTMMLLTLDPLTRTAGMLSIPRDMWVAIPGFKHGKINTAHFLGDAYQLPGGGPALAVKTVETFLGVPVNYYAQIDFDAFVRFIDEIGGVKLDIPERITIDLLGAGQKTKKNLKPGIQVLPGDHALAYARARYTEGGDFDRADRQQQVVLGIRNRILEFSLLPSLIQKAPLLYQELSSGIHTNMTLDQMIQLAVLAQSVPDDGIQKGVLGTGYVQFATSPDQLSILIPYPDQIRQLRDQIFTDSGGIQPGTPGDAGQRMAAEKALIYLVNASGDPTLGERTAAWLAGLGATLGEVSAGEQVRAASSLSDFAGSPFTMQFLAQALNINVNRISLQLDPSNPASVTLVLGQDWANDNPLP